MYKQIDISGFTGVVYLDHKYPHETWDYLSFRLYGDSSYYKVIWQINNIIDPNSYIYKSMQVPLLVPESPQEAINFINSIN